MTSATESRKTRKHRSMNTMGGVGHNVGDADHMAQSNELTDKKLQWVKLPTELKERIIELCMHQPHGPSVYRGALARYRRRYNPDYKNGYIGPSEIVDQLGDWYQLLYVSHQVRAITLRLCLTGGSRLTRSEGLCVVASSCRTFSQRYNRLGEYYQMVEPNSVPTDRKEEALSKCYRRFPRIYPKLARFATFRHGIQKISLGMDFLSAMNFFMVEAGGFQRFQKSRHLTYHIFERLPHLNEVVIRLPMRPRRGWKDDPMGGSVQLFHDDSPCPRILHRVIYERVAQVLAPYNLKMRNFIDREEGSRCFNMWQEAVKAVKFSNAELEELYTDDGGGVELPEEMDRVSEQSGSDREEKRVEYSGDPQEEFFPPLCLCNEPCISSPAMLWLPERP